MYIYDLKIELIELVLWMAYAAVQAYQPALPIELTSILTMTDSNIAKAVKDTRYVYLKISG